ncbi:uncharacterized protein CPUR_03408 [Claviceps purpurea 20.1]|uniref:RGS domain-containing protein n=1 Tax=Claviceps purpurea (strain 20.1) TaxID=1111077 RepID=M1W0J5_CLAP2|nr:uncharacterized protein CPUR_03408 [Claviceps purpurea 20.1]
MPSSTPEALPSLTTIYNFPPTPPKFDPVGTFYIAFGASWTLLVVAGMLFCALNHDNPVLKIRCIPLSFGAIILLHSYWILAQVTYSVGMSMPIVLAYDIQYFFMGVYYPLGMALFHASNLRFLRIAKLQRHFARSEVREREERSREGGVLSGFRRVRGWEYTAQVMFWVGLGISVQILLTIVMWLACKKYHPSFGMPGTEIKGSTFPEQLVDLGRGWEWWPSLLWQLVWTWIVAPYLIWQSWDIRDTMGWRTQTIACCTASLHAVPMFLIASYVPAFQKVNVYFAPSQWIHLSIMVFEIFALFVPAYLVIRSWSTVRRVNTSNDRWEVDSMKSTSDVSSSIVADWKSSSTSISEKEPPDFFEQDLGDRFLTMAALDYLLRNNPTPLQNFSAMHDFSGENIAFLTRAARFKASWPVMPSGAQVLDVYNEALGIYTDFISTKDAEFPLNLASRDLKAQEDIFEYAARSLMGGSDANPATPFDVEAPRGGFLGNSSTASDIFLLVQYRGPVPDAFSLDVFDQIESHVKYLVLTNTWPKFVGEMRARRREGGFNCSEVTMSSQESSDSSRFSRRLDKVLRDMGL